MVIFFFYFRFSIISRNSVKHTTIVMVTVRCASPRSLTSERVSDATAPWQSWRAYIMTWNGMLASYSRKIRAIWIDELHYTIYTSKLSLCLPKTCVSSSSVFKFGYQETLCLASLDSEPRMCSSCGESGDAKVVILNMKNQRWSRIKKNQF